MKELGLTLEGPISKVAEISIIYKREKDAEQITVKSSKDVEKVFRESWDQDRIDFVEDFKVMFLSRANKVLGLYNLSGGGTAGVVVDPRVIFMAALKVNASHVIVAHNHPSGVLKPSNTDIKMTSRLKKGGELLEITVLDHVILTSEGYYSFADNSEM